MRAVGGSVVLTAVHLAVMMRSMQDSMVLTMVNPLTVIITV